MRTDQKFQCCYCDERIDHTDRGAVLINISGLWSSGEGPAQDVFAHSRCLAEKFAPSLSAHLPFVAQRFFEPD